MKNIENLLIKTFDDLDIHVNKIIRVVDEKNFGLIHEPVMKFTIHTNLSPINVVIKIENINNSPEFLFRNMYQQCNSYNCPTNMWLFDECCYYLSIKNMPEREYLFYKNIPDALVKFVPKIWNTCLDRDNQIIIMEDLSNCINMNKIDSPESWNQDFLLKTMEDLAFVHYHLCQLKNHVKIFQLDYQKIQSFLYEFHQAASFESGINVNLYIYSQGKKFISKINTYEEKLSRNSTVIHNDFNIRNICISQSKRNIKIYDWEFLDIACPMFDIVDFLVSISPQYITQSTIDKLINTYRLNYCKLFNQKISQDYFLELLYYSALKYSVTRMNMYLLCYKSQKLEYIERMYCNLINILKIYNID